MTQGSSVSITPSEKKRFFDLIESFKQTRVLVIGDLILDQFIWGSVDRISPEAPVPVVNVQRESYMPGGALNVANNVHSFGGIVLPCGVVGRDAMGRMLLRAMRAEGINTGGVIYDATRPTSVKTRVIAHSQQVVRFDREKADDVSAADHKKIVAFVQAAIQEVDVLVIEDYGKGMIYPAILRDMIRLAKKHKKPILVDPKEKHFSYYTGVTALTPNRKEAFAAFNGSAARKAPTLEQVGWNLIKKLKCQAAMITLGEDGMAVFERGGRLTRIPTAAREVYDVSGAGDTVMAVFSMAVAAGAKMREAAMLANLAAGIVVGKLGTATASPAELKQAVEKVAGSKSSRAKRIRRKAAAGTR